MSRAGALCLLALLAGSVAAQTPDPTSIVDSSQGVVDGKTAISFWAAESSVGPVQPSDLLPTEGMEVLMVPADNLDEANRYPCGQWLSPLPGKYKFWLEGQGLISPASSVMAYSAPPFEGRGRAHVSSVVPAGRIGLSREGPISPDLILRLLHTESHNQGSRPRSEMSRSVPVDAAPAGVLMPEGPVLAGLFDVTKGEYAAISKPVDVFRDRAASVDPRPPATGTDLVVILDRPRRAASFEGYDVSLSAVGPDGSSRPPELSIPTSDRIFGIWYGLSDKYVTLQVASPSVFMKPSEIVLPEGEVARYHGQLSPLPDLEVKVHLPEGLVVSDDAQVEVKTVPGGSEVAVQKMTAGKLEYRFAHVPARRLEAALSLKPWYFTQRVDLEDGISQTVVFEPRAYRISGTVFRGDEGTAAEVTFSMSRGEDDQVTVGTDESGEYEMTLFRGGVYVALVRLEGSDANPHREAVLLDETPDGAVVNFRVPDHDVEVVVVDAVTRLGIANARVVTRSTYPKGQESVASAYTGENGRVKLRPLSAGKAACWVEADGYHRSDPRELSVTEDPEQEVTIALIPIEEAASLRVRLSSGAPAAEAELLAVASLAGEPPLWRGQADSDGLVEIPEILDGAFILVRHPEASSAIHPWSGNAGASNTSSLTLPPPTPPLAIQVKRPWGQPAGWASMAIWIDGKRVTHPTLGWLTRSTGVNGEGFWRGHHLPPSPVRVLAWKSGSDGELANHLDSMAQVVPFPWNDTVEVETIE